MAETTQTEKIDLYRILRLLLRQFRYRWWIVLVLAVLLGGFRWFQAYRSYSPVYEATATYTVSSGVQGVTDLVSTTSYYDSQAREQIVESFSYILASEAMQERIKNELKLDYIPGSVTAESVGDTSFFKLTATSGDPEMALRILEAVVNHYPEVASFVVGNTIMETIEEPRASQTPINSNSTLRTTVIGAGVGALLGLAILLALALTQKTVERKEDLHPYISLSCLGTVPKVTLKKRSTAQGKAISLLNPNVPSSLEASITELRVHVQRKAAQQNAEGKVLLVTSTLSGEGKTVVSTNLAISLAKSGKRVVLVDADLRNQMIRQRMGLTAEVPAKGLLELLQDRELPVETVLQRVDNLRLWLLAGDSQMTSPMQLLASKRMHQIIAQLRLSADVVILDSPPAGLLGDTAVLSKWADFVLYVVRSGGTRPDQIADTIGELEQQGCNLLGYVLNGVSASGSGSYGTYGKYGKYGKYGSYGRYGNYGKYGTYGSYGNAKDM